MMLLVVSVTSDRIFMYQYDYQPTNQPTYIQLYQTREKGFLFHLSSIYDRICIFFFYSSAFLNRHSYMIIYFSY